MKADEAAELINRQEEEDSFNKRASVAIAALAMLLALTGLGGGNATKEAINNNVLASNHWSFFQAKNQRQANLTAVVDQIELAWLADPALPEEAKAALRR